MQPQDQPPPLSARDCQGTVRSSPRLPSPANSSSVNRPTNDVIAYDLYLRACAMVLSWRRKIFEALHLLQQAFKAVFAPERAGIKLLPN